MRHLSVLLLRALALCAVAFTTPCVAAESIVVPRSVEADTLGRSVFPQSNPLSVVPPMPEPPKASIKTPKGAEQQKLKLKAVELEGGTVYKHGELEAIYSGMIGSDVAVSDVYALAQRIAQRYRDDGYILANAWLPPQTIKPGHGSVKIKIVEGHVADIRWTGDKLDNAIARSLANELVRAAPFNGKTLESVMLRLNSLPSVVAQATIAPYQSSAAAEEGAVEIAIAVTRKRVSIQANFNDSASRYVGTWQDSVQIQFNGLATGVDQLTFSGANSVEPGRFYYERGEYAIPVNSWGTTLRAGVSSSHSAPGYTLKDLKIRSQSNSGWLELNQSLIKSRAHDLGLSTRFTVTNFTTDILDEAFYEDRIRDLNISAAYSIKDTWGGVNALNLSFDQGLNILGATKTGSAMLSRAEGHSDFSKVNLNFSRLQDLMPGYSLMASFSSQFSTSPLLSMEQFGYGGTEFGRAFDFSEISGDDGAMFSLELRHDPIDIWRRLNVAPFVFIDGGCVWNLDSTGESTNAASTGFGMRMAAWDIVQADFTVAKPFTSAPSAPKLGATGKDPRMLLSVRFAY